MPSFNLTFAEWSKLWEEARCHIGSFDKVIALCKTTPRDWQRADWTGDVGYRHNHKEGSGPRGEQHIEKQILQGGVHEVIHDDQRYPFRAIYQKMPLANQATGQRVADVFGLLTHRRVVHPVMIEVKTTNRNCWYALVECLQQVRMGRANQPNIQNFAKQLGLPKPSGIWGMVLAPTAYIKKSEDSGIMQHCLVLLAKLKPSNNRIAICKSDELSNHLIRVVESNWS